METITSILFRTIRRGYKHQTEDLICHSQKEIPKFTKRYIWSHTHCTQIELDFIQYLKLRRILAVQQVYSQFSRSHFRKEEIMRSLKWRILKCIYKVPLLIVTKFIL